MSLGSVRDHLAAASLEPTHISWEADPDIASIGVSPGLDLMLIS